jgi:hypothetical protein
MFIHMIPFCGRFVQGWLLATQFIDGLLDSGGLVGQVDGQELVAALFQGGDGFVGLALRGQELSVVE